MPAPGRRTGAGCRPLGSAIRLGLDPEQRLIPPASPAAAVTPSTGLAALLSLRLHCPCVQPSPAGPCVISCCVLPLRTQLSARSSSLLPSVRARGCWHRQSGASVFRVLAGEDHGVLRARRLAVVLCWPAEERRLLPGTCGGQWGGPTCRLAQSSAWVQGGEASRGLPRCGDLGWGRGGS